MGTRVWHGREGGTAGFGLAVLPGTSLPVPGAISPRGEQAAGGAWLSLPRPVGVSLGKKDLALVQQTLWPRADGDGCGFPLSPPFSLAEAHGWGELCITHCGRVSPLGIAFWHGDPRRERLARGCLLRVQLLQRTEEQLHLQVLPGGAGQQVSG